MSVISEIASWSLQQPDWIADAMRRATAQGHLSDADIADLCALVKAAHGLPDPEGRVSVRLDPNSLPAGPVDSPAISLVSLRAPQNLNAITAAEGITFAPQGLTIVYGHNGAGKSGYARVLKKACRARDTEGIHPNVFAAEQPSGPAQVELGWKVGDQLGTATWIDDGQPAPASLSRVAVFDSHCARVFVDDQAKVAYVPYGLGALQVLAVGMRRVAIALETEARAATFDEAKLSSLKGDTVVGRMVATLTAETAPKDVTDLTILTDAEAQEVSLLTKLLREEDPSKQALVLRRFATRLQAMEDELDPLTTALGDGTLAKLKLAFEELNAADAAAKLAAKALVEGSQTLAGTGTDPWQILMQSAIAFATEQAYPDQAFPGPAGTAQCVLCQQLLTPEAHERLLNFVKFLEADTQRRVVARRAAAAKLYREVAESNVVAVPSDRVLLDELKEQEAGLATAIGTFVQALAARKAAVVEAAPKRRVGVVLPLPPSPAEALKALRTAKVELAVKLEKSLTAEERKEKTARLNDLEARLKLRDHLVVVLEAVGALKGQKAYAAAIKACNSSSVTTKANELYEATVTAELRTALAAEFEVLGLPSERVGLEMTGQRGARMQQLRLSTSNTFAKLKPSDILSEGEQRAIALASFLAEIAIEPDRSGIIFDDPVSSLDQVRRERIAVRLAQEAKVRQVVVFTHDLAFAWALREAADEQAAEHAERHVYAAGPSKGHSCDSLPFEAKKLPSRVNDLRTVGVKARKALVQDQDHEAYNDLVRQGYRRLRDTWELVVEDLLFNKAVKRFRRSVETTRLSSVLVEDDDIQAVTQGMTRCSFFTHDGGDEAPPPLPSPDEFAADIERLGTTVERLTARLEAVAKRRKADGMCA